MGSFWAAATVGFRVRYIICTCAAWGDELYELYFPLLTMEIIIVRDLLGFNKNYFNNAISEYILFYFIMICCIIIFFFFKVWDDF